MSLIGRVYWGQRQYSTMGMLWALVRSLALSIHLVSWESREVMVKLHLNTGMLKVKAQNCEVQC